MTCSQDQWEDVLPRSSFLCGHNQPKDEVTNHFHLVRGRPSISTGQFISGMRPSDFVRAGLPQGRTDIRHCDAKGPFPVTLGRPCSPGHSCPCPLECVSYTSGKSAPSLASLRVQSLSRTPRTWKEALQCLHLVPRLGIKSKKWGGKKPKGRNFMPS